MDIKKATAAAAEATMLVTTQDALKELSIDAKLKKLIKQELKTRSSSLIPSLGLDSHAYILVKKAPDWKSANEVRKCFGALCMRAQKRSAESVYLYISSKHKADVAAIAVQGASQGAYRFDRYVAKKRAAIKTLAVESTLSAKQLKSVIGTAQAINDCRDLINTPAEDMGPEHFVKAARKLVKGTGVRVRIMDATACKQAGLNVMLAVGRASHRKARLLILEAGPKKKNFFALCGKGVCFDTGGLGIKPSKSMELMRKDMGGAATVLAALIAAARQGIKKPVRVYIPLVENAIDGSAFRPGDIFTAKDGTTVEIGHTDAEGRLILADALCQARHEGAGSAATVATLTGAALVALGRIHVPVMGDDEKRINALEKHATACGEKVWRLPLDEEHRAIMNTPNADINNSGNGEAGCITAGAFLKHFADTLPFMHCDISPCSWKMGDHDLGPVGATGVLVHSLSRLLLD